MMDHLQKQALALLLAVQFLTTIPTPGQPVADIQTQGLSLLWYPVVGLLLGVFVTLLCIALPMPFYVQAMLAVALWIILTGGLHLDGLADCADAWMGGLGDRDRTLQLLKDPLCGSMAVIALLTVIGLKAAALAAVIQNGQLLWFWAVPLLARLSLLLLFLSTPYVRAQGLGEILAQHFSRTWALRITVGVSAALCFFLPLDVWCGCLMAVLAIFLTVRWAAMRRLGGFTGDVAGAQVELVEVGLLLLLASRSVV
jgi:adenosylcobinamide-GDP ribazoletransferase